MTIYLFFKRELQNVREMASVFLGVFIYLFFIIQHPLYQGHRELEILARQYYIKLFNIMIQIG